MRDASSSGHGMIQRASPVRRAEVDADGGGLARRHCGLAPDGSAARWVCVRGIARSTGLLKEARGGGCPRTVDRTKRTVAEGPRQLAVQGVFGAGGVLALGRAGCSRWEMGSRRCVRELGLCIVGGRVSWDRQFIGAAWPSAALRSSPASPRVSSQRPREALSKPRPEGSRKQLPTDNVVSNQNQTASTQPPLETEVALTAAPLTVRKLLSKLPPSIFLHSVARRHSALPRRPPVPADRSGWQTIPPSVLC